MRVGIVGLLHESNTFICEPTTTEHFQADVFSTGENVRDRFAHAPHEIGGFFQGLEQEGIERVPIFAGRATPFGPIEFDTAGLLWTKLVQGVNETGKNLDGVLAAAHGAAVEYGAVQTGNQDFDGHWLSYLSPKLSHLRGQLNQIPIIATLDLHANLSQQMVDATTALIGYRTNPHIDQRERGIEAARLMARTLRGEVRPTMAAAFPRVAINIERQLTSEPPCSHLYALADEMLSEPMVLSNSILLGFPYSDVPKMGSSVVVVTDNQPELAQQLADQLAREIEINRHQFAGQFLSISEAIDSVVWVDGPNCLLDMGDNVGGGSPGDGTALAWALHHRKIAYSFVCINDSNAAAAAAASGIGSKLRLEMGGRGDQMQGPPLVADVTVLSLHEGKFTETGTTHGGVTQFDQGPTAIVRTDHGLTIMLTSIRTPPFSLRQLTAFGIDPRAFRIIVAKGVHAPRAAYAAVCKHFVRVDTPGVTRADMTKLKYHHRRRPLFPFEEIDVQGS